MGNRIEPNAGKWKPDRMKSNGLSIGINNRGGVGPNKTYDCVVRTKNQKKAMNRFLAAVGYSWSCGEDMDSINQFCECQAVKGGTYCVLNEAGFGDRIVGGRIYEKHRCFQDH
mgnify:CR=1 FL=1